MSDPNPARLPGWHATTILMVRKGGKVVIGGDGQVSVGETIMKGNARKVRRLAKGEVVAGFAGSTADALTLFERLEKKIEQFPGQLPRACVELGKDWRTDRYLRRLEAMLLVADKSVRLRADRLGRRAGAGSGRARLGDRHRLGRQLRPRRSARAVADRIRRRGDRPSGDGDRRLDLRLHQRQPRPGKPRLMVSERSLDLAVAQGIITPDQADRVRALDAPVGADSATPGDPEALRFISGFGDIFVALGVCLFLIPAAYFADLAGGAMARWATLAALAWLLAELFTRRLRMALPSILLLVVFASSGFFAALTFLSRGGAATSDQARGARFRFGVLPNLTVRRSSKRRSSARCWRVCIIGAFACRSPSRPAPRRCAWRRSPRRR